MIPKISQSGLLGVQRGMQQVSDAANEIATADRTIDVADLATSLVDLKMGQKQVEASAMTIKVDDQLRGTLLDIKV